MKLKRPFVTFSVFALLLVLIMPGVAQADEGSAAKDKGSMMKEEKMMHGKEMMKEKAAASTKSMACDGEHLKMMLQKREDRECVVDGILADEDTREILMEKIAADENLRKKMMKKCGMMEEKHGEGSMMKEGSTMKEPGSGSKKK
jgi:hypothetical protein